MHKKARTRISKHQYADFADAVRLQIVTIHIMFTWKLPISWILTTSNLLRKGVVGGSQNLASN